MNPTVEELEKMYYEFNDCGDDVYNCPECEAQNTIEDGIEHKENCILTKNWSFITTHFVPRGEVEKKVEEESKDTKRLNFLDSLRSSLNKHYGTSYDWEMITNHNINRLFLGDVNTIDLNDGAVNQSKSVREAIDKQMKQLLTQKY